MLIYAKTQYLRKLRNAQKVANEEKMCFNHLKQVWRHTTPPHKHCAKISAKSVQRFPRNPGSRFTHN